MRWNFNELCSLSSTRKRFINLLSTSPVRGCQLALVFIFVGLTGYQSVLAQDGAYRVWGDVRIDDSKADTPGPSSVTVILYDATGTVVARQTVGNNGRYRFNVLRAEGSGQSAAQSAGYDLAIETDSGEITRVHLSLNGPSGSDFRQDFEFEWKSKFNQAKSIIGTVSAADAYKRSRENQSLFQKAQGAVDQKNYEQAVSLLSKIVDKDKLDFQAWTILGTVYVIQEKTPSAENAYLRAIEARPTFALALLDLGRLRTSQKKFEEAIDPLTHAVAAQPESGEANLLLGESYLQIRKGSKAIAYLNEASRLGKPEARLRLGWLYNAAGMKDKAALEYEEFLKEKPDYPDRKKVEEYIKANKKS
jgi:tetratricopeptide (TPR) repeat protein